MISLLNDVYTTLCDSLNSCGRGSQQVWVETYRYAYYWPSTGTGFVSDWSNCSLFLFAYVPNLKKLYDVKSHRELLLYVKNLSNTIKSLNFYRDDRKMHNFSFWLYIINIFHVFVLCSRDREGVNHNKVKISVSVQ